MVLRYGSGKVGSRLLQVQLARLCNFERVFFVHHRSGVDSFARI